VNWKAEPRLYLPEMLPDRSTWPTGENMKWWGVVASGNVTWMRTQLQALNYKQN
jgi:hypothetical protein